MQCRINKSEGQEFDKWRLQRNHLPLDETLKLYSSQHHTAIDMLLLLYNYIENTDECSQEPLDFSSALLVSYMRFKQYCVSLYDASSMTQVKCLCAILCDMSFYKDHNQSTYFRAGASCNTHLTSS